LLDLLRSAQENAINRENFEFLIKFDDDEPPPPVMIRKIRTSIKLNVKCTFGPKRRGYIDIHQGYKQAFDQLVDPRSVLVGAMADDFVVAMHMWDGYLLHVAQQFPDNIFFVHGRPHPPYPRQDYLMQRFCVSWEIRDLEKLYIIDEAPLWGRRLIDLCGGFGPVSFTDAWTLALQKSLWDRHQINRTAFLGANYIYRRINDETDAIDSPRSLTDRAANFKYIASEEFANEINRQADLLALHIKGGSQPTFPPHSLPSVRPDAFELG
jgi:hypothetical protein